MASYPTTKTIIIAVVVAVAVIIIIPLALFLLVRWRKRINADRATSSESELTLRDGNPYGLNAAVPGQPRDAHERSLYDPSRERAVPRPFTNTRDRPYPGGRSQHEEYGAVRRAGTSRPDTLNGREVPMSGRLTQQQPLHRGETRLPDYRDETMIPQYQHPPPFHQNLFPPTPSTISPPFTATTATTAATTPPETADPVLDSPIIPDSTSLLYHSHLHPTPPTTHLHAPPSSSNRERRVSRTSLISSAASAVSMTKCVNAAYAATQRKKLAAPQRKGEKRNWARIGLGSEGSSSGGRGWEIKGQFPNIESTLGGSEAGASPSTIDMPTPPLPLRTRTSSRPRHPAAEGTPQLGTISDAARRAPTIRGVERSQRREQASSRPHDAEHVDGETSTMDSTNGPPDAYGRGSMTEAV